MRWAEGLAQHVRAACSCLVALTTAFTACGKGLGGSLGHLGERAEAAEKRQSPTTPRKPGATVSRPGVPTHLLELLEHPLPCLRYRLAECKLRSRGRERQRRSPLSCSQQHCVWLCSPLAQRWTARRSFRWPEALPCGSRGENAGVGAGGTRAGWTGLRRPLWSLVQHSGIQCHTEGRLPIKPACWEPRTSGPGADTHLMTPARFSVPRNTNATTPCTTAPDTQPMATRYERKQFKSRAAMGSRIPWTA